MSRDYVLKQFRAPVQLQIDYAQELNPQQYAAVSSAPGPALVIAGAGSGKTRTLTYRVAYLIEHGIQPHQILLLTFTNKASKEMMRRVNDLLGADLHDLWGGTFHSIGARLIRTHAERLGFRKDFTILDREDSRDLVKACLGDPDMETTDRLFPKADALVDMLSLAVNKYASMAEAIAGDYPQFLPIGGRIEELARRYAARKKESNVMDFDDLQTQCLRLLVENADVLERLQHKFQFILVDEYQDTNTIQGRLIDLLAAGHKNLMVVGDDSQSIYSWRGANFRNILEFPERYPGAKVFKIETNYRSTPEILQLANAAIAPNRQQFQKQLESARKSGSKPAVVPCADASVQAAFVCQRILELREEGVPMTNMAVLYRSHFHVMEIQLEMTRRQIPFLVTSGIRFFEQAHIKDLTAFLKFTANRSDEIAFKRIAQMFPGVGAKAAEKIWSAYLAQSRQGEGDAVEQTTPKPRSLAVDLQKASGAVPKKAQTAWAQFTATMAQIEPLVAQPGEMIQILIDAIYEDYLKETFDNHRQRAEEVEQLGVFAHQFADLDTFLTQLSLLTSAETDDHREKQQGDDDRVRLTTIHQAKGLEYDVVFLIMLCDGLFPSGRSLDTSEGEEEERRLFYVGITRSKNELYLSYPLLRYAQGQGEMPQMISRFLIDLPSGLYEEWNLRQTQFGGY